jgi:hypothetical protein
MDVETSSDRQQRESGVVRVRKVTVAFLSDIARRDKDVSSREDKILRRGLLNGIFFSPLSVVVADVKVQRRSCGEQ